MVGCSFAAASVTPSRRRRCRRTTALCVQPDDAAAVLAQINPKNRDLRCLLSPNQSREDKLPEGRQYVCLDVCLGCLGRRGGVPSHQNHQTGRACRTDNTGCRSPTFQR